MNNDIQSERENWKLGIIYYNPNDSRTFVYKKVGIGCTLNFAQPISYLVPITVILLAILLGRVL